jgi:uncharacterized YigZ family protein
MNYAGRRILPAEETRAEIVVVNSRFIAIAAPVSTVEDARLLITRIRGEFPDASHHVPAYVIGFGASIIEHCSDDREPTGTAGRPVLGVIKGSGLGDIIIVVTRYFGGTKLGTGGLVRAYTQAAQTVLEKIPLAEKIATVSFQITIPYSYYDRFKRASERENVLIIDEVFSDQISIKAMINDHSFEGFWKALLEMTNGSVEPLIIERNSDSIFPVR